MEQVGQVERQVVAKGTKSERAALVLRTPAGDFVLRRVGGSPFQDPELEKFLGQTVHAEGEIYNGNTFFARNLRAVGEG